MIATQTEQLRTQGRNDCVDITATVQAAVTETGMRHGQATVFVPGSTVGVTTIEFEPGVVQDLQEALRRLLPDGLRYHHHETAGDDNGQAHVRAAFIGPSLTVLVLDGRLALGTWQQMVLVDFDTRPRTRAYHIQLIGEAPART